MSPAFIHEPHPRIEERKLAGPVKTNDARGLDHQNTMMRFNARFGLTITNAVGTMWTAYIFTLLAFCSLPYVLSGFSVFANVFPAWLIKASILALVAWIAQTFLQLVLLPIIIVGQNIQAQAADKRSEDTYKDASAILHEAIQIEKHLEVQDATIEHILSMLEDLRGTKPAPQVS
jgi:hypothetical protein